MIEVAPIPANPAEPIGYECRFAVYCGTGEEHPEHDLHLIKEIVHYADGRTEPQLRLKYNYKRPFYVTKKAYRNHEQKKEWEDVEKVEYFESTQSRLLSNIARALGQPGFQGEYRRLARSPYLYGSDILSTATIKKQYQDKWPNLKTGYTVAVFDTETDVVHGTNTIIMATISMKNRVYTAVRKDFLDGQADVVPRAKEAIVKYLSEMDAKDKDKNPIKVNILAKRGIDWEVEIVDTEIDIVKECFKRAHQWRPDFLAIWNIDFDIKKVEGACERAGIHPAEIFSDPSVPKEYWFYRYKQGQKKKKMASGKEMPIKPADQWHTVYAPASFYAVDAMCVYRKLRVAKGEEPSYALDFILDKILGMRKLKFAEADGMQKIDWHIFLQSNYKIEYIIYNVFDCISMEELDEKTVDLSVAMPLASGPSDFETFKSQPRRTADRLHYFALANSKVFGSTSDQMSDELDKKTLNPDGWIVTLPAHLVMHNGLKCIEEYPELRTNIRIHVADLDVAASYPNGGAVFNTSKQTTYRELCKIEGVSETMQRMQGINLSSGHTNAVEICTALFKMPTMEEMLLAFQQDQGLIEQAPQPTFTAYGMEGHIDEVIVNQGVEEEEEF